MRISQLEGHRVALWGWGREGRAAFAVLRARLPALAVAVVYFFYKRSILGTIALGMLVYLPLHIGVGW